eukprot:4529058-Alexandrium_andersonii.AAC.1
MQPRAQTSQDTAVWRSPRENVRFRDAVRPGTKRQGRRALGPWPKRAKITRAQKRQLSWGQSSTWTVR